MKERKESKNRAKPYLEISFLLLPKYQAFENQKHVNNQRTKFLQIIKKLTKKPFLHGMNDVMAAVVHAVFP